MRSMRTGGGDPERSIWLAQIPAEPHWSDSHTARLPAIAMERNVQAGGLEELLFVLCGAGDILVTHQARSESLMEYQRSLGFRGHSFPAAGNAWQEADSVASHGVADLLRSGYRLRMYAVTPAIHQFAERNSLAGALPAAQAVRRVNSKTWSAELGGEHGFGTGGVVVRSCEELRRRGTSMLESSPLVAKEPFGVSGLGSIRVDTERRLGRLLHHLERQEAAGLAVELILEPFVPVEVSFSTHIDLDPSGRWTMVGTQETGNHGFRYSASADLPRSAAARINVDRLSQAVNIVAKSLHAEGYFGPVCMDSLLLADGTVVPVGELNCRVSMGRMNIAINSALRPFGCSSYLTSLALVSHSAVSPTEVLQLLYQSDLLFMPGQPNGVIPLAVDPLPGTPEAGRSSAAGRIYLSVPFASDAGVVRPLLAGVVRAFRKAGIQAQAAEIG